MVGGSHLLFPFFPFLYYSSNRTSHLIDRRMRDSRTCFAWFELISGVSSSSTTLQFACNCNVIPVQCTITHLPTCCTKYVSLCHGMILSYFLCQNFNAMGIVFLNAVCLRKRADTLILERCDVIFAFHAKRSLSMEKKIWLYATPPTIVN